MLQPAFSDCLFLDLLSHLQDLRASAVIDVGGCQVTIRRVRKKLERLPGGDRQVVDILGAILTDGLDAVEAACAEALSHNVHSAGVVLNILARHREPPPPLTIATPDALKLDCEPQASLSGHCCAMPCRAVIATGMTA